MSVVLNRLLPLLPAVMVVGEHRMGALVARERLHQLRQMLLLLPQLALHPRVGSEDPQPLALRRVVRQRHGALQRLEVLLRRRRRVRQRQVREREVRVLRDRLFVVVPSVRAAELLRQVSALQEELNRLPRGCADGHLP